MKSLIENKAHQLYEIFFPQPNELTQEEKQEVIDDFNGNDAGKKIDARVKMINATFGVLQSAVAGVAFQYYQDFYNSESDNGQNTEDLFLRNKDFLNRNSEVAIGLSICFAAVVALDLAGRIIVSQVNSNPHIISQDIKRKISSLTPQQLIDGIRNIEEGSETALNIKMPRELPFARLAAKNIIGLISVYSSSLTADQQLLTFAASLTVANFAIDQFEKRVYQNSTLYDVEEGMDNALLNTIFSAVPFMRNDIREAQQINSIIGKRLDSELSSEQKQELSLSIKNEMEKLLAKQSLKEEVGQFFLNIAQMSAFMAPIITNPGSKMVEDDHFASALDFAIGSVASNVSKLIGDNVSLLRNNKVKPVSVEEVNEMEDILKENIEQQEQEKSKQEEIGPVLDSPSAKLSPRSAESKGKTHDAALRLV
jgi:hypothetical protein